MQRMGLNPSYITTRNEKINAVSLLEINRVARELLKPDDLHFVVAGQPIGLNEE
jgi:zinc protease